MKLVLMAAILMYSVSVYRPTEFDRSMLALNTSMNYNRATLIQIKANFDRTSMVLKQIFADLGEMVYRRNCVGCHNVDPGRPGNPGPAVRGVARDVLERQVLQGGRAMPAFPKLKPQLDVLAAYLESK